MVALNLCGSLRELRRKNGIKEFYRYQRNLQELLKEDEELLRRGQNDQLQENAYEDRRKLVEISSSLSNEIIALLR